MLENRCIYLFNSGENGVVNIFFVVNHLELIALLQFEEIDAPLVNIGKFVNEHITQSLCLHGFGKRRGDHT